MKMNIYRVTTYILLPVAILFGLMGIMLLFVALGNPPLLLPLFVVACVVIYVVTSFIFLNKGILQARPCKRSLKDWIKVNAIVSIVFSVMILVQTLMMMAQPGLLSEALDRSMSMQGNPEGISRETMLKMTKTIMYVFAVIALLLLIHITLTFRMLKKFRHVFEATSDIQP